MSGFIDRLKNAVKDYEGAVGYDPGNPVGGLMNAVHSYENAVGYDPTRLNNYSAANLVTDAGKSRSFVQQILQNIPSNDLNLLMRAANETHNNPIARAISRGVHTGAGVPSGVEQFLQGTPLVQNPVAQLAGRALNGAGNTNETLIHNILHGGNIVPDIPYFPVDNIINTLFNLATAVPRSVGTDLGHKVGETIGTRTSPEQQQKEQQKKAEQARMAGKPDYYRPDSAWESDPSYAVVRTLTASDRVTPFINAKNSQEITDKTTNIVLGALTRENIHITPEAAQAFKEGANAMLSEWYTQQISSGRNPSIDEYYKFMTDAVLELNNQVSGQTALGDTTSQQYPMMNTPQNPVNVTQAAYDSTANPSAVSGNPTILDTSAKQGTRTPEPTTDEAKLIPSADMMQWGGGTWGDGKPGMYGNIEAFNAYMGWIHRPDMATYDKTPDAFDRYYGWTQGGQ